MSLLLQKNLLFSNYKSSDSALNFHSSQSARVSPISKFQKVDLSAKKYLDFGTTERTNYNTERTNFDAGHTLPNFKSVAPRMRNRTFHPQQKQQVPPTPLPLKEDVKINSYLTYLLQQQKQSTRMQQESQNCAALIRRQQHPPTKKKEVSVINAEVVLLTDVSIIQVQGKLDARYNSKASLFGSQLAAQLGSMTDLKRKADLVYATYQRITSEQQHNYDTKHADKIVQLRRSIQELMKYLNQLSSFVNNKKKLFYVVKKLIYLNVNLKKVLTNDNFDALLEPMNEQNLLKQLQHTENMSVKSQSIPVIKYDFSIQKDLLSLTEWIQEYILQQKVEAYELMETNIKAESREVQQIEALMLGQAHKKKLIDLNTYTPVKQQDFSFKTQQMTQYNPHVLLDMIEQRLGYSNKITVSSRTVGKSIEKLVSSLDKNYLS